MTPLSDVGERFYRELLQEYGSTPEVRHLARDAAHWLDVAEQARVKVEQDGLTIAIGRGVFVNPALRVEVQARADFRATMRILRQPSRRVKLGRPGVDDKMHAGGRLWPLQKKATRASRYVSG